MRVVCDCTRTYIYSTKILQVPNETKTVNKNYRN